MAKKGPEVVGTSSSATVVVERSSGNGFTVLEFRLFYTNPGVRFQSTLPMRLRSSWACSVWVAVPRKIFSTPTV